MYVKHPSTVVGVGLHGEDRVTIERVHTECTPLQRLEGRDAPTTMGRYSIPCYRAPLVIHAAAGTMDALEVPSVSTERVDSAETIVNVLVVNTVQGMYVMRQLPKDTNVRMMGSVDPNSVAGQVTTLDIFAVMPPEGRAREVHTVTTFQRVSCVTMTVNVQTVRSVVMESVAR